VKVPFVDLKAQYESIKDEIDSAISDVINSSAFIGGRFVAEFEKQFAEYAGAKYCISVGNGTDAIYLALAASGVRPGHEVITAANTFIATSEAITATGADVVFVDCDPATYNIDTNKLEAAVTDKTKAIIPVHLYGRPAEMDEIRRIAAEHGIEVIEDAAQAHGAEYRGAKIGSDGNCACFSFYPGKNLGAFGDAGAVVTDNPDEALIIRMFANHGRMEKYSHEFEGVNSRMDGLQAAILSAKLKHLDEWNARRRGIAEYYDSELAGAAVTPAALPHVKHVFHLYVIRVKNREKIIAELREKGVGTGIHYPIPLPFLRAYARLNHKPEDFPAAYSLKDEILSIPIHGSMPDEQVEYTARCVKAAIKNNA